MRILIDFLIVIAYQMVLDYFIPRNFGNAFIIRSFPYIRVFIS